MISALNQPDARWHTRRAELARLLRRGVVVVALASLGLGAAHAQRNEQRDDAQPVPHSERFQLPREDNRAAARAFEAREEQRRQAQMQQEQMRNSENNRRSGRMTPDERRDLRRQINEAGMDLYPNPQRR
ncbi:hypothetical protein [Massilia horti]|uniref:Uncharacterized protein n=1 Tax=Massilia horti TaxID=2562153 RepID=A0A4Y9SX53_9BURK|nr:hypothetical protein [Massilia horti]TFW29336.1 hypothetical protein E4O92_19215 [Massilia horti]